MTAKQQTPARSLHEWMERHQVNARALVQLVYTETGHSISETMMSFILRGSRRCSRVNAFALHMVTKVPMKELTRWPRSSDVDNVSGKGQNHAA
jgi:hypothetical protein